MSDIPREAARAEAAPVTCLLVDDLAENLLALSALLRGPGVTVLTARSGREALELLLTHEVALAFIDVQMPEMDGFELAELLRGSQRTRHIPLIFVTAGARDQHRMFKGYETGAVDFLYKPIDPFILRNKADVFFQLHRQKLALAHELRERTETLRLNEMFTAVLGHDLRNPLSALVAAAQMLERRSNDEMVQKTAARMRESGRRMSRMIEDLLDLSRSRLAGGIVVRPRPADLGDILDAVLLEHRAAHPDRRIDVLRRGDLRGEWDAARLAQAASNLIGNALQHGEASAPIEIGLDGLAAESVSLVISNAGAIPPELLPHVFDPFRGSGRAPARRDGLGLGLYIVRQIVQAHGGVVCATTPAPNTTAFEVSLPRVAVARLGE